MNSRSCIDKTARGRNDKDTRSSTRRPRKCGCVRNFPAEVEAAQKREHLGDWRAIFAAQFSSEFELRTIAQNHSRSLTSGVSGREKKDATPSLILHSIQFSTSPAIAAS